MSENLINTVKHLTIIDPSKIGKVHIIGCGAVGSKIALEVAKLGCNNLHLWDFDTVESGNIANQVFPISSIGKLKVDALSGYINFMTGYTPEKHPTKVEKESFTGIVFLCVDSMSARKEIFESCIQMQINISCMIDTRMGVDCYSIFSINPRDFSDCKVYSEKLYGDNQVEETDARACVKPSLGATSSMLASHAVWQMIKHVNIENESTKTMEEAILEKMVFVGMIDIFSSAIELEKEM